MLGLLIINYMRRYWYKYQVNKHSELNKRVTILISLFNDAIFTYTSWQQLPSEQSFSYLCVVLRPCSLSRFSKPLTLFSLGLCRCNFFQKKKGYDNIFHFSIIKKNLVQYFKNIWICPETQTLRKHPILVFYSTFGFYINGDIFYSYIFSFLKFFP